MKSSIHGHGPRRFGKIASMILAGSLFGVMTVGAATAATPNSEAPAVVVKYADLDISTDRDLHILYKRIVSAATEVCPQWLSGDLHSAMIARSCREAAIGRAVQQINSPWLAALHANRNSAG
jgi:UrcA family protein